MKEIEQSYEFEEILKKTKYFSNTRDIVILGIGDYEKDLTIFLNKNNINVSFYISDNGKKIFNNKKVKSIQEYFEYEKYENYYLIIAELYNLKLRNLLFEKKLIEDKDYVYCCHPPVTVCIHSNYTDQYGNEVIFHNNSTTYIQVTFKGYYSKIIIGNNFMVKKNLHIYCDSNCKVEVEDNVRINYDSEWYFLKCSLVTIGSNCVLSGGELHACRCSKISIGEKTTIGKNYFILAHVYTNITIGEDCAISSDFHIRTNDGHSIFDIVKKENINVSIDKNKHLVSIIKNHVWIGTRVTMLGDSTIGTSSIIGACSLVKAKIPNNCIAAGIPAEVKKKDITWSRENYNDEITWISQEYIHSTSTE